MLDWAVRFVLGYGNNDWIPEECMELFKECPQNKAALKRAVEKLSFITYCAMPQAYKEKHDIDGK